ncbi:MAG: phenylalanine--tRNA ligase subunit beta, partial [Desulfovibrionaceae bacterium]
GTIEELAHRLTMIGNEVEEVIDPFARLEDIVIGKVLTCEKHPEADKLSVCTVDAGGETLGIVCGAPNVAAGQTVPVAKVGATLPGGLKLKKAKIRGVRSEGMILSEREMELSEDHEGIMVLDAGLTPGDRFVDALNLERCVLDVGVTPNRADCLSVLGLARETAVAFGLPLTLPKVELSETGPDCREMVRIEIPEPEYCPLYMARILQNVAIAKSPEWMRMRLLAVGVRPISNVVDATNYVLMELGQPLHAFDNHLLEGGVIRVARASDGQTIETLDGQQRKLLDSDLLIWDGVKPVALAGVMGGANTEIHDKSTEVLLECAVFRPASIRKTARRLALPSEASFRFERGVDQVGARLAMDRAAQLMAELSGGSVSQGVSEYEPRPWRQPVLPFRRGRCNSVLGLDLDEDFCRRTFSLMGCQVEETGGDNWWVSAPPHRLDLEREVDLFEEAGRVYGLDRIPTVLPRIKKALESSREEGEFDFIVRLKDWGRGAGLREAINYSFVAPADLDRLGLPEAGRIAIANPLSEDQSVLRTSVLAGLLGSLRRNLAQGNVRLRLFETAHAFFADEASETTAREELRLGLLLHGPRHARGWPWEEQDADYLDVKGLVEHLLDFLKIGQAEYARLDEHPFLSPAASVSLAGETLGALGRVKPDIADFFHAQREVWAADLDGEALRRLFNRTAVVFESLPTLPPVRRDLTLGCPAGMQAGQVERVLREVGPAILESVDLVNVYEPEDAGGERNLSFRLTYRHPTKTLKDKEVDKEQGRLIDKVTEALPVHFSPPAA